MLTNARMNVKIIVFRVTNEVEGNASQPRRALLVTITAAQFQLLASFCHLSKETVDNSLDQLGGSDFINTQLLSSTLLNEQIQRIIDNNHVIEGITTLIGLYGGLVIIYRLIAIVIVKYIFCAPSRITS
ncbi:hypothetical protein I4U23_010908 [Adineta vaga]|nr:hypothetical protein I4U23_010908 [Adineta vaga]